MTTALAATTAYLVRPHSDAGEARQGTSGCAVPATDGPPLSAAATAASFWLLRRRTA